MLEFIQVHFVLNNTIFQTLQTFANSSENFVSIKRYENNIQIQKNVQLKSIYTCINVQLRSNTKYENIAILILYVKNVSEPVLISDNYLGSWKRNGDIYSILSMPDY